MLTFARVVTGAQTDQQVLNLHHVDCQLVMRPEMLAIHKSSAESMIRDPQYLLDATMIPNPKGADMRGAAPKLDAEHPENADTQEKRPKRRKQS